MLFRSLKMNSLNIGMEMQNVHLPLIKVRANCDETNADSQIEPSALLSHLGIRGIGKGNGEQWRTFFGVDYLAFFDIFKNYYANKQEKFAWIIHNKFISNNGEIIEVTNKYYLGLGNTGDIDISIGNNDLQEIYKPKEIIIHYENGLIDIERLFVRCEDYNGIGRTEPLRYLFNSYTADVS